VDGQHHAFGSPVEEGLLECLTNAGAVGGIVGRDDAVHAHECHVVLAHLGTGCAGADSGKQQGAGKHAQYDECGADISSAALVLEFLLALLFLLLEPAEDHGGHGLAFRFRALGCR
jgi:hypothetical protein